MTSALAGHTVPERMARQKKHSTVFSAASAVSVAAEKFPRNTFAVPTSAAALRALSSLANGYYADFADVGSAAIVCDSHLSASAARRYALTSGLDWQVLPIQGRDGAEEQVDAVSEMLDGARVYSAVDKGSVGGLPDFIAHLLSAIAFGFAVSALSWIPAVGPNGRVGVSLAVTNCPHRIFRRVSGELVLRTGGRDSDYQPLSPRGEWAVSHIHEGSPLLPASVLLSCAKMEAISDWAATLEKFGMPFISATTTAPAGSEDWAATEDAIRKVGVGFAGVFGKDVELNLHAVAQGNAPHAAFIDYVDRAISRLWLGGDLTLMGAQNSVGVSAQSSAQSTLARSDAAIVEQVFDSVIIPEYLRRIYGGTPPVKVYFRLTLPKRNSDPSNIISRLNAAKNFGIPVSREFVYDALELPAPKTDADILSWNDIGGVGGGDTGKEPPDSQPQPSPNSFAGSFAAKILSEEKT